MMSPLTTDIVVGDLVRLPSNPLSTRHTDRIALVVERLHERNGVIRVFAPASGQHRAELTYWKEYSLRKMNDQNVASGN